MNNFRNQPGVSDDSEVLNIIDSVQSQITAEEENPLQSYSHLFRGRSKELRSLFSAKKNSKRIFWLYGRSGVGKTALAKEFTEIIRSKEDGTRLIPIDLKGKSKQPLTLEEVQSEIINEVQPGSFLPPNPNDLEKLFKKTIERQKLIFLLDNALDDGQIRDIFQVKSDSNWIMVVTSQKELSRQHKEVHCEHIENLAPDDSKILLESIAPTCVGYSNELVELCRFSPLAILWVGKFIKNRKEDPCDYIQGLKAVISNLDFLEGDHDIAYQILSLHYENYLGDDEKNRWCDLAIFRDTFDINILKLIWGKNGTPIKREFIEAIQELSLVEYDNNTKRFYMHHTAQKFLKDKKDEESHLENMKIFTRYFLNILNIVNANFVLGGSDFKSSQTLLALEWNNIQAGYAISNKMSERPNVSGEFKEFCTLFPIFGSDILSLKQHPNKRLEWIINGLTRAVELKSKKEIGILMGLQALSIRYQGKRSDIQRSLALFDFAIGVAERCTHRCSCVGSPCKGCCGCKKWYGIHKNNKGNAYAVLGVFDRAILEYNDALSTFDLINDNTGKAIVLNNLTRSYINVGENDHALSKCLEAKKIVKEVGDTRRLAGVHTNLGLIKRHFGDISDSISNLEEAEKIYLVLEDQLWYGISLCLVSRSRMDLDIEGIKKGIDGTEKAKETFKDIGEKRWEGIALGNIGVGKFKKGDYGAALKDLREALNIANIIGDERRKAIHNSYMGRAYQEEKQYDMAINFNEIGLGQAISVNDKRRQAIVLLSLGICFFKKRQLGMAVEYLRQSNNLSDRTNDILNTIRSYYFLGRTKLEEEKYSEAKNNFSNALLKSENSRRFWHKKIKKYLDKLDERGY